MVRITGNHWAHRVLLILSVFSLHAANRAADISIRMINRDDGAPLTHAQAGRPFVVEVMVQDIARVGQYPEVKGLSVGVSKNAGVNIRTINGRTTVCYLYEMRIDQAGTYEIGPAVLNDGKAVLQSGTLQVEVHDVSANQPLNAKNKDKKASSVFMRFTVDKSAVVVGERITCSLRFYTQGNATIKQLIEQEMAHMTRKQIEGPTEGNERVDGAQYHYAEWTWYLYPKDPGSYVIPAYGADYEEPVERDHYWGGLGRFFGNRFETKRVYSNAVSIKVLPLPAHTKPIDAVGSFSSFTVSAHPLTVALGEGITVAVEVVGDGDPESIKCPVLRELPNALKWYESKKTVQENDSGDQTLTFEFVVQGLKQGKWTIPAQLFHYYDVEKSAYRTLKSSPVEITITPSVSRSKVPKPSDKKSNTSDKNDVDVVAPLHVIACDDVRGAVQIPWSLMIVLVILPIGIGIGLGVIAVVGRYRASRIPRNRAKNAFSHGLLLLQKARHSGSVKDMYHIFINSIADRLEQSPAMVTSSSIQQLLRERNVPEDVIQKWHTFFESITHDAYSNQVQVDDQLVSEAEQWLKRLDTYLSIK